MTSSAEARWAIDTSVSVAALDASHEAHHACRAVVVGHRPALAGHAAFETYSVLTRLPVPLRLAPDVAVDVLAEAFPEPCWLDPGRHHELLRVLGGRRVAGGSTYDALVGWAARTNDRILLTRDRRAERTYRALDVRYEFIGGDAV